MTCLRLLIFLFLTVSGILSAESITCRATADTWIAMHPWDQPRAGINDNHGAEPQLIIRGRESFALLSFDCPAAAGMTVAKAILRVQRRPDPVPLHTVGISTVSGTEAWDESASLFHPRKGRAWSYPGSDLIDVTFGQGGSLYAYKRARDVGQGWYEIDVPPLIVHTLLVGDQFGLMLTDEKGQTQTRHVLNSRESDGSPVLVLEGERSDSLAPGAVRPLTVPKDPRALRPGSVVLRFGGAGDDSKAGVATRHDLRYSTAAMNAANFDVATPVPRWCLNPLQPKAHPMADSNALAGEVTAVVDQLKPGAVYFFAVRAIDEAGNRGPVSPLGRFEAYHRTYPSLPAAPPHTPRKTAPAISPPGVRVWAVPDMVKIDPRTGELLEKEFVAHRDKNPVWDAETGTVTLTGSRNEFVAFQIAVESSEPIAKLGVTVTRPLFSGVRLPAVFERAGAVHVYREWFVPDDRNRWYPDALIPASDPLALPSSDNPVPGQRVQPFFVDVYIPHSAKPGPHAGAIQVAGREIRLVANVLPLTLPDRLNFIVDLNCYSGVPARAQRGTPEYRKIEQAYHRVAHLHRTNLDVLGYSHNGTTVADHAPPLTGEGKATKIADWGAWDDHFGGLLDGSAFRDLPRSSVPVPAMYLPFFENWPGDLRASYKYPFNAPARTEEEYQQIITRHALEAPPVEEAFSQAYQDRYSAVVVDFARHLRERKWTRTNYLVYFNNKYYYKRPSQGGRGISWWLMDEPNHRDDVRASAFLGWLTERWLGDYQDVPILFRTDISRVEWIRDLMAGQIDLNCISKRFFEKNRYLLDDRVRFGREYWNYASTNHPRESNVAMRAWCWRVWLNGGNGLLPWNAVRGDESWNRAEPLTVFYPGAKFGQDEPFASLRLKAYRRGQQDIEYLILLAEKQGWGRDAVARAVAQALDLSGGITQTHEDDAGAVAFSSVNDSSLDEVRLRIARALERH